MIVPSVPRPARTWGRGVADVLGIIGTVVVVTFLLVAIFAPLIAPYDPSERVATPFLPPSELHPLGTNDVGQDLLSELVFGTRVSLAVGIISAVAATLIGTAVGILAGYYPKRFGAVLMRTVDVVLILPFLPLLIVLAAYLGRSLINTIAVIALLIWAEPARIIRSQVMSLRSREYVLASQSIGARDRWIILRHVLPRTGLLATGSFVRAVSAAILLEAALSFLGLGDPIQESWGSMLFWAQSRGAFLTPAWQWWVLPPGIAIMLASLGFAFIAFALEERIDPRL
jgi:peptide/nickel transport system permease protein